MLATIVCDLCGRDISGIATEVRLVRAVAGTSTQGKPYLVPRDEHTHIQVACTSCSRWIEDAIVQLKQSFDPS